MARILGTLALIFLPDMKIPYPPIAGYHQPTRSIHNKQPTASGDSNSRVSPMTTAGLPKSVALWCRHIYLTYLLFPFLDEHHALGSEQV